MKWITRKDIKVDRVACPWLIKRFVDPHAEFFFVEERELLERAKLHDAIPFDAPKIEAIKLNHRGSRCSFEAILEDYAVADPVLQKLALIVRAADVKGQEGILYFSFLRRSDHEQHGPPKNSSTGSELAVLRRVSKLGDGWRADCIPKAFGRSSHPRLYSEFSLGKWCV